MILDNKKHGKVGDELRKHLRAGVTFSAISQEFSIYGFDALKADLKTIDQARLLLCPLQSYENSGYCFESVAGDQSEIWFRNQLRPAASR